MLLSCQMHISNTYCFDLTGTGLCASPAYQLLQSGTWARLSTSALPTLTLQVTFLCPLLIWHILRTCRNCPELCSCSCPLLLNPFQRRRTRQGVLTGHEVVVPQYQQANDDAMVAARGGCHHHQHSAEGSSLWRSLGKNPWSGWATELFTQKFWWPWKLKQSWRLPEAIA